MANVLRHLRALGYHVCAEVVNTLNHGLPQFRARMYVVGVRRDVSDSSIVFPDPVGRLALEDILSPWAPGDSRVGMPPVTSRTACARVSAARASLPPRLEGRDWMVDEHLSSAWAGKARDVCPCLLFSQSEGRFVGSRGRSMSFAEACRAQGLLANEWSWPARVKDCFGLIGNSMSICVLDRLLVRVLRKLRPGLSLADPWESGAAQVRIRSAAIQEAIGATGRAVPSSSGSRALGPGSRLVQSTLPWGRAGTSPAAGAPAPTPPQATAVDGGGRSAAPPPQASLSFLDVSPASGVLRPHSDPLVRRALKAGLGARLIVPGLPVPAPPAFRVGDFHPVLRRVVGGVQSPPHPSARPADPALPASASPPDVAGHPVPQVSASASPSPALEPGGAAAASAASLPRRRLVVKTNVKRVVGRA